MAVAAASIGESLKKEEDLSYLIEPANRLTFNDYSHKNAPFMNARAQRELYVNDPPVALCTGTTYKPWPWEMDGPQYYNPYPHQVYRSIQEGSNDLAKYDPSSLKTTPLITHAVSVDNVGQLSETDWDYPEQLQPLRATRRGITRFRTPDPPSYQMQSGTPYMGHNQFYTKPGVAFQKQFQQANFLRVDEEPTRFPLIGGKPQSIMPLMTRPLYDHRFPEELGWAPREDVFRLRSRHRQYTSADDWYPTTA